MTVVKSLAPQTVSAARQPPPRATGAAGRPLRGDRTIRTRVRRSMIPTTITTSPRDYDRYQRYDRYGDPL